MIFTLMLLALQTPSSSHAQVLESSTKPERGDLAVFDCTIDDKYLSYADNRIRPADGGVVREVFHIKAWDNSKELISYGVTSLGNRFSAKRQVVRTTLEGKALQIKFMYFDLGSMDIETTVAPRGKATLKGRQLRRHGEGENQFTGNCVTWIKQAPKPPKAKAKAGS